VCVSILLLIVHLVLIGFGPQRNAARHDVWGSLAQDFLPIMASSVSSERIFHSAGIKMGKHRSGLDPDLFEALSFLGCAHRPELLFHQEFSAEWEVNELERV